MVGFNVAGLFGMLYYPFHAVAHSKIPYKEQMEGLPGMPYFEHTYAAFDTYSVAGGLLIPTIGFLTLCNAKLAHAHVYNYITKMQYNKDQELLFITFTGFNGQPVEEVFEMEHLEILPPSVKSGIKDLSSQDEDGLYMITCMNSGNTFYVYKEDMYWNPALKAKFFERVMRLWDETLANENLEPSCDPEMEDRILRLE